MGSSDIRQLHSRWKAKGSEKLKNKLLKMIWEEYHPRLQVYLNQMGIHGEEVPDLVSELLLNIFENLDQYNNSYAFSTWLYTICRNRMIDRGRKKKLNLEELGDHHGSSSATPEAELMREEEKLLVRKALSRLNELDRELVYLHFYEEMKYREISEVTEMPVGTVKYRMSEIRKMMKENLEKDISTENRQRRLSYERL